MCLHWWAAISSTSCLCRTTQRRLGRVLRTGRTGQVWCDLCLSRSSHLVSQAARRKPRRLHLHLYGWAAPGIGARPIHRKMWEGLWWIQNVPMDLTKSRAWDTFASAAIWTQSQRRSIWTTRSAGISRSASITWRTASEKSRRMLITTNTFAGGHSWTTSFFSITMDWSMRSTFIIFLRSWIPKKWSLWPGISAGSQMPMGRSTSLTSRRRRRRS